MVSFSGVVHLHFCILFVLVLLVFTVHLTCWILDETSAVSRMRSRADQRHAVSPTQYRVESTLRVHDGASNWLHIRAPFWMSSPRIVGGGFFVKLDHSGVVQLFVDVADTLLALTGICLRGCC